MKSKIHSKKQQIEPFNVESALELIINSDSELKEQWDKYIEEEYHADLSDRLVYTDIGVIIRFIVNKYKKKETDSFPIIFSNLENILKKCDKETKDLITVGLFEGIQNVGGQEIDYYYGFNKWLYTLTGEQWRAVIDFWEGTEWRKKK